MKKILFFEVVMTVGQLCSLAEDCVYRFDTVKPLLSAHQILHSKMDLFCQSAIQAFGVEGKITVQQVLDRLDGAFEQDSTQQVQFLGVNDFLSWVDQQKKTILVLTDRGNIKSAICLGYMQYLSQQPGFSVDWYAVDYDHLAPILLGLKDAGNDIMQSTDVVPNAIFVIDGQLWQIPEDLATVGLKYWIDQYAMV